MPHEGSHLSGLDLFCIFDTYAFRGKDVRMLPLMTTDEDVVARPTFSRLRWNGSMRPLCA